MKENIQQYIEKTFLIKFEKEVTEECNLFQLGIIDSFGYIQLISYLEKEFGIKFTEEEFLSNGLVSLSSVVNSVFKKIS
jgi:acyl carrier protein